MLAVDGQLRFQIGSQLRPFQAAAVNHPTQLLHGSACQLGMLHSQSTGGSLGAVQRLRRTPYISVSTSISPPRKWKTPDGFADSIIGAAALVCKAKQGILTIAQQMRKMEKTFCP